MSASATDPASQLRQAALLTLKAKRRKAPLAPEQLLPPILSRPVVEETPSITLDYGEDDSAPTQPSAPSTSAAVGKSQPSSAQLGSAKGDSSATQDVSMREEGEISENEDEPSPSAPPQAPAQPVAPLKPASPVIHAPLARSPSLPTPAPPPSRPSLIDTDSAIRPVPTSSPSASSASRSHFSERTQPVTPKTTIDEYTALHRIGYIIDENHVRPGLTMTQDQYNTAKDIVLDLLGWGVAPEYLVHCGLSREIVYYVFTELNLRLPTDFDSTGILPFPPTKSVIAALFSSTTTPSTPTMRAAAAVQYPSGGSAIHGIVSASRVSNAQSPGASTSMNGLSAAAPTFIPKSSNPSSPSAEALSAAASLADMEQRTKRQLLARKAVLDSRKRGNSGATSSSHSASKAVTIDTKAASRPLAPAASVDDFLNSIDPTSAGSSSDKNTGLSRASTLIFASSDAMDVDDDIPGLSSGSFSKYFGASSSKPSATTQSAPVTAQDAPATTEPPNHSGSDDVASSSDEAKEKRAPGPSSNGNTLSRKKTEDASGDGFAAGASGAVPGSGSSSHSSSTPVPAVVPRRGTKRPVASDFVDVDSTYNANPYTVSSLSRTNSTNGNGAQEHGNGYTAIHHPNPHVRRKLNAAAAAAAGGTSFASVSNMRRCVIDVSDTEDEDGEEDGIQREASKAGPSRPSGTGSGGTPRPGSAMGEKSAVELELEIKKMREMIREREEMRLRKLAAQSNRSTRSSTPTAALPQSAAILVPHAASISVPGATMQEAPDFSASVRDTSEGAAMENSMDADPTPANGQPSTHAGGSSVSAVDQNDFHKLPPFTPTEEAPAEAAPGTPHQVTGEQVLTAEARQEQVVPSATPPPSFDPSHLVRPSLPSTSSIPTVGGDIASVDVPASTQERQESDSILEEQQAPRFRPYDSLFSSYPLLGHLPTPQQPQPSSVVQSTLAADSSTPDLRPLKARAFRKHMAALGLQNERICQYEVPGGGECRDAQCSDLHLSRVVADPSDEETAMYLGQTHPTAGNVSTMLKALQEAQARAPQASFEQHVEEAWASLVGRSTR